MTDFQNLKSKVVELLKLMLFETKSSIRLITIGKNEVEKSYLLKQTSASGFAFLL